uniref:Putative secreted protein n=1 Tax=Ixodes ricinus TaxID=34613 RepID=A0A6B0UYL5_IXORI
MLVLASFSLTDFTIPILNSAILNSTPERVKASDYENIVSWGSSIDGWSTPLMNTIASKNHFSPLTTFKIAAGNSIPIPASLQFYLYEKPMQTDSILQVKQYWEKADAQFVPRTSLQCWLWEEKSKTSVPFGSCPNLQPIYCTQCFTDNLITKNKKALELNKIPFGIKLPTVADAG